MKQVKRRTTDYDRENSALQSIENGELTIEN